MSPVRFLSPGIGAFAVRFFRPFLARIRGRNSGTFLGQFGFANRICGQQVFRQQPRNALQTRLLAAALVRDRVHPAGQVHRANKRANHTGCIGVPASKNRAAAKQNARF